MIFVDTGAVTGALAGLRVDPVTIESILSLLTKGSAGMEDYKVRTVEPDAYGGAHSSYRLSTNATMARDALAKAMMDLTHRLQTDTTELRTHVQVQQENDETSAAESRRMQRTLWLHPNDNDEGGIQV